MSTQSSIKEATTCEIRKCWNES